MSTTSCYQQHVNILATRHVKSIKTHIIVYQFALTDTHGGPGGFHQLVLYDVTCLGFIESTYTAFVNGIVQAIVNAHNSMFPGRVFLSEAQVPNVGRNRSPYAYDNNPQAERNRFSSNMDLNMLQMRFMDSQNQLRGAFHWLAIHATSMNNTNRLVSTDNFGVASLLLEQEFNPGHLVGQGTFIGGFSTAHSGDISPNTERPRCIVSCLLQLQTDLTGFRCSCFLI